MEMEKEYSIGDLAGLLLRNLKLIIAITLCGGLLAFAFSKLVLPVKYSSQTKMYVEVKNNSISTSQKLTQAYLEVLKDNAIMDAVGDKLVEQYDIKELQKAFTVSKSGKISPSSISSCLTISAVGDTPVIKIVATTSNPEIAADICNNLAEVAPRHVEETVGGGTVSAAGKASVNKKPISPRTKKNTVIGMVLAFLAVVVFVFIIDVLDDSIRDADEVVKRFKRAIIGEIRHLDGDKKDKGKKDELLMEERGLLTNKDVPFSIIEGYKKIRANVLFAVEDSDKKIIAVSSPNPDEGKGVSAANLAIVLAQTGKAVLLVDADMRKPVQHLAFHVQNNEGLSTLITKKSALKESIKSNIVENMDLLPSGPLPFNPSELLGSDGFKDLINELSSNYDYVIIDTPPVNAVSDAMVIKDSVTGIMLVIRYAKTTYDELSECMKQIELAKVNMLGFVISDVQSKYGICRKKHEEYGSNLGE